MVTHLPSCLAIVSGAQLCLERKQRHPFGLVLRLGFVTFKKGAVKPSFTSESAHR